MSHPYKSSLTDGRALARKRYAEGGSISFDSSASGNNRKDMQHDYRAGFDVPLSDKVSLTGGANYGPELYGPGKTDVGAKAGLKFKFKRGGGVK